MPDVRLIKHEAIPGCGSFEVRPSGGLRSRYFYWDDVASRRLRPEQMTRAEARELATSLARGLSMTDDGLAYIRPRRAAPAGPNQPRLDGLEFAGETLTPFSGRSTFCRFAVQRKLLS